MRVTLAVYYVFRGKNWSIIDAYCQGFKQIQRVIFLRGAPRTLLSHKLVIHDEPLILELNNK